jgi:hypothetical protein
MASILRCDAAGCAYTLGGDDVLMLCLYFPSAVPYAMPFCGTEKAGDDTFPDGMGSVR